MSNIYKILSTKQKIEHPIKSQAINIVTWFIQTRNNNTARNTWRLSRKQRASLRPHIGFVHFVLWRIRVHYKLLHCFVSLLRRRTRILIQLLNWLVKVRLLIEDDVSEMMNPNLDSFHSTSLECMLFCRIWHTQNHILALLFTIKRKNFH